MKFYYICPHIGCNFSVCNKCIGNLNKTKESNLKEDKNEQEEDKNIGSSTNNRKKNY